MNAPVEVWPGPLEGVMREPFLRAAAALHLTDRWMTPFLRLSSAVPRRRRLDAFLAPFLATRLPVTLQLMGTDPAILAETARAAAEAGAAGINLNFGCPSRQVTSGGAGGGVLRRPERMAAILTAVRRALPDTVPLSVKLRCGWEAESEMPAVLDAAAGSGAADRIFFHCRTVREQYRPVPAPERQRRMARAVARCAPLPVIVNGDIAAAEEGRILVRETGAAGVMCARFWLRDPGLLLRLRGEPADDAETLRRRFFRLAARDGLRRGAAIELSNFLWGDANPWFETLRKMAPDAVFDLHFMQSGATFPNDEAKGGLSLCEKF